MQRVVFLAAEADLSFDDICDRVRDALLEQYGRDDNGCSRMMACSVFPQYVIARDPDDALYQIPYNITGDVVTLGDPTEVERAYVPVASECEFIVGESESDDTYPIVIIKPGWANGAISGQSVPHYYTPEFCKLVAEAAQGVPFGRRHPDQRGSDPTGALDATRVAGFVSGGTFDGVAKGNVTLYAAETDLRSRLSQARQTGTLKNFGVSMLAAVSGNPGKVEGKPALIVSELHQLYSVDLCQRAGAGGQFLAAASFVGSDVAAAQLAAVKPNPSATAPGARGNQGRTKSASHTGVRMNKHLKALLDALKSKNPTKAADFFSRAALATEAEQEALQAEVIVALAEAPAPSTTIASEAATQLVELTRAQSRNRIEQKLTESKLGEPAKKLARQHLETLLASEADLKAEAIDAEIAATREAFAAFENVGRVRLAGVTMDSQDKMALAMEAALGVKSAMGKGVPKFKGLREAYITITGDADFSKLGSGGGFMLASEAISIASFPNLLLDALHKRLAQDYAENTDGLESLYSTVPLDDYRQRNVVRDGYFSELAVVNEGSNYLEIGYPTDERTSYTPAKRGGLLTITEETIRNDDLGAVARWPGKMARAARNSLRQFVANLLISNPNYGGDGVAVFHAAHNNLGANAFGLAGLTAAQLALRRQVEPNSGEYMGMQLNWIAIPPELEQAAIDLNQTATAGSSSFWHRFGANSERIFVVERFTDTNDWYYGADPTIAPFLEIGFLDGKEQPEILLANMPTVGQQFLADELQYKVKHVWGGTLTDYRGIGKNVNA